jgi:predicted Rossmann fold nucleotide-binding protein DprA/Smf involved in DNA uptake
MLAVVKSCRIQAGISIGLVLIQSSLNGGSRFTVKTCCESGRPISVIQPVAHDFNLESYEANLKIINDKKEGLSDFTGLKVEQIRTENIYVIKSKEDYEPFESILNNVVKNKSMNSLFY